MKIFLYIMEQEGISLLVGLVLTTIPQIIWSIWKETRFVGKDAVILYGFSSIGFGLLYIVNVGLDDFIGQKSLAIFLGLGVLFLFVRIKFPKIWKNKYSLLFSHKMIGGFQLSFIYFLYVPLIFITTPEIPRMDSENVLWWGILAVIVLWVITGIVRVYKNSSLYH